AQQIANGVVVFDAVQAASSDPPGLRFLAEPGAREGAFNPFGNSPDFCLRRMRPSGRRNLAGAQLLQNFVPHLWLTRGQFIAGECAEVQASIGKLLVVAEVAV